MKNTKKYAVKHKNKQVYSYCLERVYLDWVVFFSSGEDDSSEGKKT